MRRQARQCGFLAGLSFLALAAGCIHDPAYLPEKFVRSAPPGPDIGVFVRVVGPAALTTVHRASEEDTQVLISEARKAIVAQLGAKGYKAKPILKELLPPKPPVYQVRFSPPFGKDDFEKMKASLSEVLPQEGVSSVLIFNLQVVTYTNFRTKDDDKVYPFLNINHMTSHAWLHVIDAKGKLLVAEAIEYPHVARLILGTHHEKPNFLPVQMTLDGRRPASLLTFPGWAERIATAVVRRVPALVASAQ